MKKMGGENAVFIGVQKARFLRVLTRKLLWVEKGTHGGLATNTRPIICS